MDNDITTTPSTDSGQQPEAPVTQDDSGDPVQPSQSAETTTTPNGNEGSETPFDPNTVPDELKPLAKQLQADYTRKTQAIAEQRKEFEALKAQADRFARYEQFIPVLDEMLSPQTKPVENPQVAAIERQLKDRGFSDEAIEMMRIMSGGLLNIFNQSLSQRDQQETARQEAIALDAKIQEAGALDPRLSDTSLTYTTDDGTTITFGQMVENIVLADPVKARQDPVEATKRAIKQLDAMLATAKTQGKEELSASAQAKARQFPQTRTSPRGATSNAQPSSIHEAWKQAQAELGS